MPAGYAGIGGLLRFAQVRKKRRRTAIRRRRLAFSPEQAPPAEFAYLISGIYARGCTLYGLFTPFFDTIIMELPEILCKIELWEGQGDYIRLGKIW